MHMNTSLIISILLGFGWILAIGIAIAMAALAYHIGSLYAFTTSGVSRMGPRMGERVASITFHYGAQRLALRDILSSERATMLVFLSKALEAYPDLLPSILAFATGTRDEIKLVIFTTGSLEHAKQLPGWDESLPIFTLSDAEIAVKLGVRAAPYGLLIDTQARLVAKGLINFLPHLCWLSLSAQLFSGVPGLSNTIRFCQPYLPEYMPDPKTMQPISQS